LPALSVSALHTVFAATIIPTSLIVMRKKTKKMKKTNNPMSPDKGGQNYEET
jgi:hypothetical protein